MLRPSPDVNKGTQSLCADRDLGARGVAGYGMVNIAVYPGPKRESGRLI